MTGNEFKIHRQRVGETAQMVKPLPSPESRYSAYLWPPCCDIGSRGRGILRACDPVSLIYVEFRPVRDKRWKAPEIVMSCIAPPSAWVFTYPNRCAHST